MEDTGWFWYCVLSATHVHCTVAVQVHYIPYFIYCNPKKTPPIPFSRKLYAAKQNEKGILVNSLVKTQYFAGLSLLISLCLSLTLLRIRTVLHLLTRLGSMNYTTVNTEQSPCEGLPIVFLKVCKLQEMITCPLVLLTISLCDRLCKCACLLKVSISPCLYLSTSWCPPK